MSCYTLFKGWLPLSPPIGFFALPVCKRPLQLSSVTFPLVLKYVGSRMLGHAIKCEMPTASFAIAISAKINKSI